MATNTKSKVPTKPTGNGVSMYQGANPNQAMTPDNKYYQQAQAELNPLYANKITALQNQLGSQNLALNNQVGGINTNFDKQVENQGVANALSKNNYSNTMLGRGMGRSSVVTSGLAQQDQINNRLIGDINGQRSSALNNIEEQKALLASNHAKELTGIQGERDGKYLELARQLLGNQVDFDFKKLNSDREATGLEFDMTSKTQQMALDKSKFEFDKQRFGKEYALDQQKLREQQRQFNNSYSLDKQKFGESKRQFNVSSAQDASRFAFEKQRAKESGNGRRDMGLEADALYKQFVGGKANGYTSEQLSYFADMASKYGGTKGGEQVMRQANEQYYKQNNIYHAKYNPSAKKSSGSVSKKTNSTPSSSKKTASGRYYQYGNQKIYY